MAVFCPYKADVVLYLECQECKNKSDCSTDNVFALLVAGSRTVTDKKMMYRHLDKLLSVAKDKYKYILIVEGGAKGADSIAGEYARDRGYLLKVMPADWDKNGKAAGFIRNKAMHELIARYEHRGCVLFWDGKSKGTAHNFGLAKKFKTTIRTIRTDRQEETKMGQFSWLYSDNGKQMVDGKTADSYLLVPPPFQEQYGKFIKDECYDGYGHFDQYDIYDLVAGWNRAFLNEDMLIRPKREQCGEEEYYQSAVERFKRTIAVLEKYKSGASDKEMSAFCDSIGYGYGEWKRNIGIDIACYDKQNTALPFPIKITSKPMEYDSVDASKWDPNQGWESYDEEYW